MRYTRRPQKWMVCLVLVALVGGMWPGIILEPGGAEGAGRADFMPATGLTVGVIPGQKVRLSLHNLSTETVQVAFALMDFQGNNLGVGPIDNPIILGPGKGAFVDWSGGPNGIVVPIEVTGMVKVFASKMALKAVGADLAASLQVLDGTTHGTLLVLPFANVAGTVGPIE